jgi:hypothetical protein
MSGVDIDSIADELLAAYRTGKTLPLTITYAASIASRSAGQEPRRYRRVHRGDGPRLEEGGGARQGKAIVILLPMAMITGTTIFDPAERAAWLLSRGGGVLLAQRRHRSRTTVRSGTRAPGSDARARRLPVRACTIRRPYLTSTPHTHYPRSGSVVLTLAWRNAAVSPPHASPSR